MEEELTEVRHTTNIFGSNLICRSIRHKHSCHCIEFVVENHNFSLGRWLTCFLLIAAASSVYNVFSLHETLQLIVVAFGLLLAICGLLHFKVKSESLLVISSLGLQVTVTFLSGRKVATFLESSAIKGIVINEVISKQCILPYLTVLTDSQQRSMPIFQSTLPRLDYIRDIYTILDPIFVEEVTLPEN